MNKNFRSGFLTLLAGLAAMALAASCAQVVDPGTPGTSPAPSPSPSPSASPSPSPVAGQRALPADFATRKAVCYSGYRLGTNSDANAPTQADIDQDLNLLKDKGFGLLRLFGSSDIHAKLVLQEIKALNLDIKVQLGVWISGPKASKDADNQAEISRAVALAKSYPDIIEAVSVGNETMVSWSTYITPVADMAAYIKQVRDQITQPVTSDDNWAFYAGIDGPSPDSILAAIDYIAIHTYPLADSKYSTSTTDNAYWDWQQTSVAAASRAAAMMDGAIGKAKSDYAKVKDYAASKNFAHLPIVIGETGWKSDATGGELQRAHPVNQKMYLDRLAAWTGGPAQVFYFEAFDEPWKGGDDGWGLWKVDRSEKYVLSGTGYAASDALYYVPVVANGTITVNKYLAYADSVAAVAGSVAVPTGPNTPATGWIGWNNPWTAAGEEKADGGAEGSKYLRITPNPATWGWGFFLNLYNAEDLSKFNNGHLRFSLRTSYAGKLELGFFTGSSTANTGCDVYLPVASGSYGFVNDGAWHEVSIPVAALLANQAPAYNQPAGTTANLAMVTNALVIADRYTGSAGHCTGNSLSAAQKVIPVDVDNIYWTQD